MSIIDKTKFQKPNLLNIPLSVAAPTANAALTTPNNASYLDEACERIEKSVLLNAFGVAMYNELQLAITDDFTNPIYDFYKNLVQGEEYDGKVWKGLDDDYSLIAYRIFDIFLTETNDRLTATGTVQAKQEGANLVSAISKVVNANHEFYKGYQGGHCFYPVYDWDYWNTQEIEISLYQYMTDKQSNFPLFDIGKFKIYSASEIKNSLGI